MLTIVGCVVILVFIASAWGKTCDTLALFNTQPCSPTEKCIPGPSDTSLGSCECLPGLTRLNDTFCFNTTVQNVATPRSSSLTIDQNHDGSSNIVAEVLLPIFLIMVVICGVYFSRKYKLVEYLRSKINRRSRNYDEVMIGQDLDDDDDPPLR